MTDSEPRGWAPNQVVAHNITKARELRSMTQAQVAERLTTFTGTRWTQATVAQTEGSVRSARIRTISVNELFALARVFDLPVLWFLTPDPDSDAAGASFPDQPRPQPWERILLYVLGHRGNYGHLAAKHADWHNRLGETVRVPDNDLIGDDTDTQRHHAAHPHDREPMTSEDALVASLYGLSNQALPGSPLGPDQIADLAAGLHQLGTALEALANYPPSRTHDPTAGEAQ